MKTTKNKHHGATSAENAQLKEAIETGIKKIITAVQRISSRKMS